MQASFCLPLGLSYLYSNNRTLTCCQQRDCDGEIENIPSAWNTIFAFLGSWAMRVQHFRYWNRGWRSLYGSKSLFIHQCDVFQHGYRDRLDIYLDDKPERVDQLWAGNLINFGNLEFRSHWHLQQLGEFGGIRRARLHIQLCSSEWCHWQMRECTGTS